MISVPALPPDATLGKDLHVGPGLYRALVEQFVARDTGTTAFGMRVFIDGTLPPNGWELRSSR